jgi:hypothetical protein
MTIQQFAGKYGFLSNFSDSPMTISGKYYPTVEHYFQAMKTLDPKEHDRIRFCEGPGHAKRLGRECHLRSDWEQIKEAVMLNGLRHKFSHPSLRDQLLATKDAILEEGNTWHDTYWGKDLNTGEGENKLGKLLMFVRSEIRIAEAKKSIQQNMKKITKRHISS